MRKPNSQNNLLRRLSALIFLAASTFFVSTMPAFAEGQDSDFRILVNGKPLTGMYVAPQRKGRRLFLPASAIAAALGDELKIDSAKETVYLRRQNGVTAEFDARSNQVRENGAVILSLASAEKITLPPYEEFLTLPTEIIIAVFDVSVQIDTAKQEIRIRREMPNERSVVTIEKDKKTVEIYQADYDYRFDKYNSTNNHNLNLNVNGRAGENKFSLLLNNSTGNRNNPFWQPRNGSLIVTRPNKQQFTAGDFSTSQELLFLQSSVQGLNVSAPAFGGRLSFFGGKSFTTWFDRFYDNNINLNAGDKSRALLFGGTFSFDNSDPSAKQSKTVENSVGAMVFGNKNSGTGVLLTGSSRLTKDNAVLRINLATSSFNTKPENNNSEKDNNVGFAADFSGNIKLSRQLSLQGYFLKVSRDFKSIRSYQYFPQTTFGGGVGFRPTNWLSGSVNANISKRTDFPEIYTHSLLTTLNIAPRNRSFPTIYFSHLETSSNQIKSGRITNIGITKDFSRWQAFANFTSAKLTGSAINNVQVGVRRQNVFGGFLQASQYFGNRGTFGGNYEWSSGESFWNRLSFSAGVGYARNNEKIFLTQRATASINLPRKTTLQFSYFNAPNGQQFIISLRGSFFSSESSAYLAQYTDQNFENLGSITGRVFQDINENGVFEPEIDKPQNEVRMRMENGQTAVTDESGRYTFSNISGSEHKVSLDPLTIRADLTMIDGQEVDVMLLPSKITNIDFRLIRTGQVSGIIWLDENGNGQLDEGEKPLADVRILAGNGRDTLTDSEGAFTIGDLPPGEYVFFVDEKTLPPNTQTASGTINVDVVAGKRISDLLLPVTVKPSVIKKF